MPLTEVWAFVQVIRLAVRVERSRAVVGPEQLARKFRQEGLLKAARSPIGRRRLKWMIKAVDWLMPAGRNCYRRALIEMAMDAGAALEPLHMGLNARGGVRSGHAWLGTERSQERYDAEFVI